MPNSDQGLHTSKRYHFIPRVLILLTMGDKILLLKGAPDKRIWPNLYNGLGGHVERGETVLQDVLHVPRQGEAVVVSLNGDG